MMMTSSLNQVHCLQTHCSLLIEAAASKIVGDDDVSDDVEYELDVVGVSGACLVAVYLLRLASVLCFELRLDEESCVFVCQTP